MNIRKLFTKGDILLIIMGVILTGLSFTWKYPAGNHPAAAQAVIEVDGRVAAVYPLDESRPEIVVDGRLGPARFKVEQGCLWPVSASCPEKICLGMGKIGRDGQVIVCIPNRILARVEDSDEGKQNSRGQVDGISR